MITAHIALVDRKRVGRAMTMLVEVRVERVLPDLLAEFNAWIAREDAVQQAWYITGDADFIMVVTAHSVEDFDALMDRLVRENPNVRSFKTGVVLRTAKSGQFVPVLGEEG